MLGRRRFRFAAAAAAIPRHSTNFTLQRGARSIFKSREKGDPFREREVSRERIDAMRWARYDVPRRALLRARCMPLFRDRIA